MTAEYMIDAIGPFPVQPGTEITARAWAILLPILAKGGWTSPEALPALLLDLATDIQGLPTTQHRMYIEQFCANRRTKEQQMTPEQQAKVEAFINARSEYVQTCRRTVEADSDYYRWQGHMEARRQLAESLGWTTPYEPGDKTQPKVAPDA